MKKLLALSALVISQTALAGAAEENRGACEEVAHVVLKWNQDENYAILEQDLQANLDFFVHYQGCFSTVSGGCYGAAFALYFKNREAKAQYNNAQADAFAQWKEETAFCKSDYEDAVLADLRKRGELRAAAIREDPTIAQKPYFSNLSKNIDRQVTGGSPTERPQNY